jgi:hypothetical protein
MKILSSGGSLKTASKGVSITKNKNNGFACVNLHYSADPAKCTDEWKRRAFYGMDAKQVATEFELSWETYAGTPVYGSEFNVERNVFKERVEPDIEFPMLVRGADFAGNHSVCVVQLVKGQLRVIDEYPNLGYNTKRIYREIVEDCSMRYGAGFHYVEVIDPSAMWDGQNSQGMSCGAVLQNDPNEEDPIMRGLGLDVQPGIQDPDARKNAVMAYLTTSVRGEPALMVNPECKMLIQGFKGGYHYPEKETQNQKRNRPVKNEYSHIHDALQYACTRILDVGNTERYLGEIDIEKLGGGAFDL